MLGFAHKRGGIIAIVAVALALTGGTLLAVAAAAQKSAPQPSPAAASPSPSTSDKPSTTTPPPRESSSSPATATRSARPTKSARPMPKPKPVGPSLPRSVPVSIRIPAIGVDSRIIQLGLDQDGSVQVPPLSKDSPAGWYRNSPTPGQIGPSIILGHIDSAAYGPAVFFKLGALQPGDEVRVARTDGSVARFRIDRVAEYPKSHFPTFTVYGNTDRAGLRLITCGGSFDASTRNYQDNIVVYAHLLGTAAG